MTISSCTAGPITHTVEILTYPEAARLATSYLTGIIRTRLPKISIELPAFNPSRLAA